MIQAAEEVVEHAKTNDLLRQEVIDAENELAKAVQAKNSWYQVQEVGLNAEAHIASPTTRMVEPTFNWTMNEGDPRMDVEQETAHYHRQSVALTDGQGIPMLGCTEVSLIMHLCFSDCLLSFSFNVWVRMTLPIWLSFDVCVWVWNSSLHNKNFAFLPQHPDHIDVPSEQYNGIAHMIYTVLAKGQHTDPTSLC